MMEKNKIYWIIAILLVNILWGNIAGNTVSQEINRPGADFSYEREAQIGSSWFDSTVPLTVECTFTSLNGEEADVGWALFKDGKYYDGWMGNSSEKCDGGVLEGPVPSGTWIVRTYSEENIEATVILELKPFEPLRYTIHISMSILMIIIGFMQEIIIKLKPKPKKSDDNDVESEVIHAALEREVNEGIWQDPIRKK